MLEVSCPSRISHICVATRWATSISCVTMRMAVPARDFSHISRIANVFRASCPKVGSSRSRTDGCLAMAVATLKRRFWPVDSWYGCLASSHSIRNVQDSARPAPSLPPAAHDPPAPSKPPHHRCAPSGIEAPDSETRIRFAQPLSLLPHLPALT